MPFWIHISKGGMISMKQKERFDEKPKQEHTEPDYHRKIIIKGITVYESFRPEGSELWDCLLQSMGKHWKKDYLKFCTYKTDFEINESLKKFMEKLD